MANGRKAPLINFDNAATTPPLQAALAAIAEFVPWYGTVHRGGGHKSEVTTTRYERARHTVAGFVGADIDKDIVIFVKNTTEAINKLAHRLSQVKNRKDIVIITSMEHHSNMLPWRKKFNTLCAESDSDGRLNLDDLERKLKRARGRVRLVAVTGVSNVTGYINPVHQIARMAHRYGAEILVDGAQLIPHLPFAMKTGDDEEKIDYLAFSAHKMYAPFGIGVLIGPHRLFERGYSDIIGGGTVDLVSDRKVKWAAPPQRDEAGTPNVFGVVALEQAIRTLQRINMDLLMKYEQQLTTYAWRKLSAIPEVKFYSDYSKPDVIGIISFNLERIAHGTVADVLAKQYGIAVRSGCFCAQPYVQRLLGIPQRWVDQRFSYPGSPQRGMVRVSFGFYNSAAEVDVLVDALTQISVQSTTKKGCPR